MSAGIGTSTSIDRRNAGRILNGQGVAMPFGVRADSKQSEEGKDRVKTLPDAKELGREQ
jgi:hypothetical protein